MAALPLSGSRRRAADALGAAQAGLSAAWWATRAAAGGLLQPGSDAVGADGGAALDAILAKRPVDLGPSSVPSGGRW